MSSGNDASGTATRTSASACLSSDAYLFDIDGTLLNTRDAVHYHAFHNALRNVFGVDSRIDGVPVHGNTDIGILRAVLQRAGISDAEFEAKLPAALNHMCREAESRSTEMRPELCPSIIELLQALKACGKVMGVVSGNLESIGWLKLRAAAITDYFEFGCFSDKAELRAMIFRNGVQEVQRLLGPQASACVVGDTPSDIHAAREAGLPVIAVATGVFAVEELRRHNPDMCAVCCTELVRRFTQD